MTVEVLLSRLSKVRGRNGSWTACCPAHEDKSPSLAIREEGGKILMRCFAGCEVSAIVGAVGMEMGDLFPPKVRDDYKPQPKVRFYATELLRAIHHESRIVAIAAFDMAKGKTLAREDLARLQLACDRINTAMEASE
jgi:hypothetical protein